MPNPTKIVKGIATGLEASQEALRAAKQAKRAKAGAGIEEIHAQRMAKLKANTEGVPPASVLEEVKQSNLNNDIALRTEKLRAVDRQAFDVQTRNPEEFEKRLRLQLSNYEFASRSITPDEIPNLADEIRRRDIEHFFFQATFNKKVLANPRAKKRAESWLSESPYRTSDGSPQVFIHVDKQTDPTRLGSKQFIQFEDPLEMGMHSGTNKAAIRASVKGEDIAGSQVDAFDQMIDEIAGLSHDPKKVKSLVAKSMDEFFVGKFTKNTEYRPDMGTFDELKEEIISVLKGIGIDNAAPKAAKYIARIKEYNTASSTPHYFRGKNGLYLYDDGIFTPNAVSRQLQRIFPEDAELIDKAMVGSHAESTRNLQRFIEDKGFDHIIYHNSVEDKGTRSIINWNPDLFVSVYSPEIIGNDPRALAGALAAFMMGASQVGVDDADVRDEL